MLMEELGERASRRSIQREFLVLREKKYFNVRSQVYVKFFLPDLPSRVIEWRAIIYFIYDTICFLDVK